MRRLFGLIFICLVLGTTEAAAQDGKRPTNLTIWDLPLGSQLGALPPQRAFTDYACGNNGGPPGRPLSGFAEFAQCAPEENGLHEVYFEYDDELEYIAKAQSNPTMMAHYSGTKSGNYRVIVSALFSPKGTLEALRMMSDPRIDPVDREDAYLLGEFLAAGLDIGAQDCIDLARDELESPVGSKFLKNRCEKTDEEKSRKYILLTNLYANSQQTEGQHESSARLEIHQVADGNRVVAAPQEPANDTPVKFPNLRAAMLAGKSKSCAGCRLSRVDLKRFDLSGADLSAANLVGANLHAADLSGANLQGADLSDANLNKANLRGANFGGALMPRAMFYEARLDNANLAGANLTGAMLGHARLTGANLKDTRIHGADLKNSRMSEVNLNGAVIYQSWLDYAQMRGANMTGATVLRSSFYKAEMRDVNLAGAKVNLTDLFDADLTDAILSAADFSQSSLKSALMAGTVMEGALLTGTIMPDGTVHE